MKVFVSSLMDETHFAWRNAAYEAITNLGYQAERAEDYISSPSSARAACLSGAGAADAMVLILGSRYGTPQRSGLSATHEEYREAVEQAVPIFVFIESDSDPCAAQAEFIREVRDWQRGSYTESFENADDLRAKVTKSLHRHFVNEARAPMDAETLTQRSEAMISATTAQPLPMVSVGIAAGPTQQLIRPAEMTELELRRFLQDTALSGAAPMLDCRFGTDASLVGDSIVLEQCDSGESISLDPTGGITAVKRALHEDSGLRQMGGDWTGADLPIMADWQIRRVLLFSARVLDNLDQQQRISRVAIAAALLAGTAPPWYGSFPWRVHDATDRRRAGDATARAGDRISAALSPPTRPRAALSSNAVQMSDDLNALLFRDRNRLR